MEWEVTRQVNHSQVAQSSGNLTIEQKSGSSAIIHVSQGCSQEYKKKQFRNQVDLPDTGDPGGKGGWDAAFVHPGQPRCLRGRTGWAKIQP